MLGQLGMLGLMNVEEAFVELDKDGDGTVNFDEFATWYLDRDSTDSNGRQETTVAGESAISCFVYTCRRLIDLCLHCRAG